MQYRRQTVLTAPSRLRWTGGRANQPSGTCSRKMDKLYRLPVGILPRATTNFASAPGGTRRIASAKNSLGSRGRRRALERGVGSRDSIDRGQIAFGKDLVPLLPGSIAPFRVSQSVLGRLLARGTFLAFRGCDKLIEVGYGKSMPHRNCSQFLPTRHTCGRTSRVTEQQPLHRHLFRIAGASA